jgi:thymidylate synthase (FAD)
MKVELVGNNYFSPPDSVEWETVDGDPDPYDGSHLAEFAGRACYQSWSRPNPKTATNAGYLEHIIDVGHLSVLEHSAVSFYITGISRSLTHELVRHRHFSFSQLSQRYVDESDVEFIPPPVIKGNTMLEASFAHWMENAADAYAEFAAEIAEEMPELKRKEIRQAARAVLPNATETKIVVTGNYRAWMHFIEMRATEAADVEIRALAIECLRQLQGIAPNVFNQYGIMTLPDRTEVIEYA